MSTRSYIGIEKEDGKVRYIYCHFDGYPSGVGSILSDHYREIPKIISLIDLGSISELGDTIESTVAYSRDRKEPFDENRPGCCYNISHFEEVFKGSGISYAYIYQPEKNEWTIYRNSK
jgi:hypothetical protein